MTEVSDDVHEEEIAKAKAKSDAAFEELVGFQDLQRRRDALKKATELNQEIDCESREGGRTSRSSEVRAIGSPKGIARRTNSDRRWRIESLSGQAKETRSIRRVSDGERWTIGMQYAIKAVGEGGVLPFKQESWQALGEELRAQIAEQCREAKVWLISADVTHGEDLRVEEFEPSVVSS